MRARDSASEVRETLSAYSISQKGILTLRGKTGFFNVSIRNKWKCIYLCFYFMIGFLWCWYLHKYFFDVVRNKLQAINIYTRVDKKKIKSSRKEYVIRTCFKFWTTKNIFWNYKPMRVWLWLAYQFTENIVTCDFSPSSFKLKSGILTLLKK